MQEVIDLQYVRFQVTDLKRQAQFLEEFGFSVLRESDRIYARGTDTAPFAYSARSADETDQTNNFIGLGFEVIDRRALERIAAIDGTVIKDNPAPGGGLLTTLNDPDGNLVDVVCEQQKNNPLPLSARNALNTGEHRARTGERVALAEPDYSVKRLGHCVLNAANFRATEAWYKERFGLLTSDEIYTDSEDRVLGAFLRCNRGETFVDHHTLFLVGTGKAGFNHAAFEVADWDTLMLGHDRLRDAGHEHRWGVGRHILGSQVFDYWRDPHGFTLEHFTDGDLFNESYGSNKAPVEDLLGTHWGPDGSP